MSTTFNNQTTNTGDPSQQAENMAYQESPKSEARMSTESFIR